MTEAATAKQRAILNHAIRMLRAWKASQPIKDVLDVFLRLEQLDPTENKDLWRQLAATLLANEDLNSVHVRRTLRSEWLASHGCWWYDPEVWTVAANDSARQPRPPSRSPRIPTNDGRSPHRPERTT